MEELKEKIDLSTVAEISIGYSCKVKASLRPKVSSSRQAYQVLLDFWESDRIALVEDFQLMLLNRANRILGICTVSSGGTSGTVLDPKIVFATALKANSSSIIVAHNHPSGNLWPSKQDKRLTKRLVEIGKALDLPILDHVIVTPEGYYSFADEEGL
ncbi:JAB domain-containing protein [Algoriphagus sp.]|uniref:JAB domain-containing protein n=1 Tax=Algoriphagus sp. TaxID=1872435 RepID=UPI002628F411|nr:JAB domain-containing protein [Algoriphagus sp.]